MLALQRSRHAVFSLALSALALSTITVTAPAFAQVGPEVAIIRVAPPPPRVEVIPARPSPWHIWQRGNWMYGPAGYTWHPGRYVMPPTQGLAWVPEEWVSFGGGYHLVPGHWRGASEPAPRPAVERLQVLTEPPPQQVEVVPATPVGQAWVNGHWSWEGARYVWVPGHQMAHPRGAARLGARALVPLRAKLVLRERLLALTSSPCTLSHPGRWNLRTSGKTGVLEGPRLALPSNKARNSGAGRSRGARLPDPAFASLSRLFGQAAESASPEHIEQLTRLYWYTLEFGL